jgi:hypothetical protein
LPAQGEDVEDPHANAAGQPAGATTSPARGMKQDERFLG